MTSTLPSEPEALEPSPETEPCDCDFCCGVPMPRPVQARAFSAFGAEVLALTDEDRA